LAPTLDRRDRRLSKGGKRLTMRVLVVAPRLEIGGAEMHLSRVLPRLRSAGVDVSLFTIARGGPLDEILVQGGVPVFGIAATGNRAIASLRTALALRGVIAGERPDILHFFLPEPYLVGSLAAAGRDVIRVMSRRSLGHYQRNHPLLKRIERRLHRSVAALIGNSTAVAAELVAESGMPRKVGIIHNGLALPPQVDPATRGAWRRDLGLPADAFVIAVIANLIAYKGHADLLTALGAIRNRLGAQWRLLLIGRDQGIGAALQRQASALSIADNILWLGERADSQQLLVAADLGVLPSHQEGFSNSLIEKMALGLPVVATRVGGNLDAVADGETGRLVPAADPAALGEAIAALYGDAGLRARMGAAARSRVERLFSLDACAGRYLNLYCGLMQHIEKPVAQLIDRPESGIVATPMTAIG
jgi:glycosyltransferase involved in cell wall biosynthesis